MNTAQWFAFASHPNPCILSGHAQTFHVLLHTIYPSLRQMSHRPGNINLHTMHDQMDILFTYKPCQSIFPNHQTGRFQSPLSFVKSSLCLLHFIKLRYCAPAPRVGGIKRWCASDVCLSWCRRRPHHKWLGHHFQGQKVKGVNMQGAGAYCGGLPHSLLYYAWPCFTFNTSKPTTTTTQPNTSRPWPFMSCK